MPRTVDVISSDWDDSGSGDSTDWSDKAYLLQSGIVKTMLALLFYDVFIGRRTKLISDIMAIYRESQPVDEILYSPLSRAADAAKIISVSFSVTKLWLTKLGAYAKKDKIQVQYFDPVTAELVSTEMYVDGYKANLKKDTSYKGLWTVGFTLREM